MCFFAALSCGSSTSLEVLPRGAPLSGLVQLSDGCLEAEVCQQVATSQEVKAYTAADPEQFAGLIFDMVATFPASPLDELISARQLQQLRAAYMPEATAMADGMRTGNDGVSLHFTMQWAIARA